MLSWHPSCLWEAPSSSCTGQAMTEAMRVSELPRDRAPLWAVLGTSELSEVQESCLPSKDVSPLQSLRAR